ncbi:unnamed protein product [Toxocara canis]|uniref:Transposase n=1 Tax=Toxocara canis TaxID=6265 RepID=A0A183U8B1_TOXCA|nr:unnamed protein product [Toxocara canis]
MKCNPTLTAKQQYAMRKIVNECTSHDAEHQLEVLKKTADRSALRMQLINGPGLREV